MRRFLASSGTLRVRLTVAVAVLSAAALTAGGALLVHAVETTVVRAIEEQSRAELSAVGGQIAGGVPLSAIRTTAPGRRLSFVRADGSRVETRWFGEGDGVTPASPPPLHPPAASHVSPPPLHPPAASHVRPPPLPPLHPPGASHVRPPPRHPPGASRVRPPPLPPLHPPVASHVRSPPLPGPGHPAVDATWSVVEMPLLSPADGPLHAFALSPLEDVLRSTRTLQRVLAVGVPALVALLTLAAWLLVGRALRPVRVMTQCAAGIADATAPDRLAVPETGDELGELAATLNDMLDRLALGAQRQREFVSDASHELRSPIAATRTQVEVALAHPDRTDSTAVLRSVLAETTRLEGLVSDLLALARLDEQPSLPREEIDLDDLVLEEAARTRAIAIDTRNVAAVKVRGERKILGQLVRNLLDNAARHAASRVDVTTRLDADAAVLLVDDDGPGIPEADRARVFERFTRLSSSRSREDGGAGLGLALVRRVAEHHGGTVRADRSPQGGARMQVRLPLDSAST